MRRRPSKPAREAILPAAKGSSPKAQLRRAASRKLEAGGGGGGVAAAPGHAVRHERREAGASAAGCGVNQLEMLMEKAAASRAVLGVPNCFQMATTCKTIVSLFKAPGFQAGEEVWRELLRQVFQLVFVNDGPAVLESMIENSVDDVDHVERAMEKPTFFDKYCRLQGTIQGLEDEISAWNKLEASLHREILQKQLLLEKTTDRWQKSVLASSFRLWRNSVVSRKQQREIINVCFAKLSKSKGRQVLQAWHKVAREQRKLKAEARIEELNSKYQALEGRKKSMDAEVKRASNEANIWMEKISELKGTEAELQTRVADLREEVEPILVRQDALKQLEVEWFFVCHALFTEEIQLLRSQLDEVSYTQFLDPELLVVEANELDQLLEIHVDKLLLRWVHFHIQEDSDEKVPKLENFSSDFADGRVLARLLSRVSRLDAGCAAMDFSHLENSDTASRQRELHKALKQLNVVRLTEEELRSAQPDRVLVLLASLFCNYPALFPSKEPWAEARAIIDSALVEQEALHEHVSRNATSHLMQAETLSAFSFRVEEVRRRVKWSLLEREQKTALWNGLRKRVQLCAWHIMLEKVRGHTVDVPDLRQDRELRAFTSITDYTLSQREDEALSAILAANFDTVKRVFEFYGKFSLGPTNASDMQNERLSAHGFFKFCKDAGVVGEGLLSLDDLNTIILEEQEVDCSAGLDPNTFVRCLVMVADDVCEGKSSVANLTKFLQEFVQRNVRLQAPRDELEKEFWDNPAAIEVVNQGLQGISSLYYSFAEGETIKTSAMTAKSLSACFHARLIVSSSTISSSELEAVLQHLHLSVGSFWLEDFVEVLVVAAMYAKTDIFVPFPDRLRSFLMETT